MFDLISVALKRIALGIASITATLLAGYAYFRHELQEDEAFRKWTAQSITNNSWLDRYKAFLRCALNWFYCSMGASFSPKCFLVCLAVSVIYGLVFFVLSWLLGGPTAIGATQLLAKIAPWQRGLWSMGMFLGALFLCWIAYRHARIDKSTKAWLTKKLIRIKIKSSEQVAFCLPIVGSLLVSAILLGAAGFCVHWSKTGIVAVALGGPLAFIVATTESATFSLVLAGTIALVLVSSISVALAGPLDLEVTAVLAVGLAFSLAGYIKFTLVLLFAVGLSAMLAVGIVVSAALGGGVAPKDASFLLFFEGLPLANALVDWVSLSISRLLGGHLLRNIDNMDSTVYQIALIICHASIDLVAAVALLMLLAFGLPFLVESFNLWIEASQGEKPLELERFLMLTAEDPWPNAIWVVAMLASTLV